MIMIWCSSRDYYQSSLEDPHLISYKDPHRITSKDFEQNSTWIFFHRFIPELFHWILQKFSKGFIPVFFQWRLTDFFSEHLSRNQANFQGNLPDLFLKRLLPKLFPWIPLVIFPKIPSGFFLESSYGFLNRFSRDFFKKILSSKLFQGWLPDIFFYLESFWIVFRRSIKEFFNDFLSKKWKVSLPGFFLSGILIYLFTRRDARQDTTLMVLTIVPMIWSWCLSNRKNYTKQMRIETQRCFEKLKMTGWIFGSDNWNQFWQKFQKF